MTRPWKSSKKFTARSTHRRALFAMQAVLAGSLAFTGAVPAMADNHYGSWISIEDGFEKSARELLRGLSSCSVPTVGPNIKLAFVGIPQNNVHFSDPLRGKLNRIARKAITEVAYNINVLTPQVFGTIANLNPGDPVQLREAIKQIKSAPLTMVITAKRPAKHIGQLKFEVFARSGDGVQVCPKSDEVFVDLKRSKIVPIDQIPTSGQKKPVVEQAWAFKHAVREAAPALREYKSVYVDINYDMSGSCSIQDNSANIFQSDYFEVGQEQAAALSLDANEWPVLENANSDISKNTAILKLQFTPDRTHRDLLQLTLKVTAGRHTRLVKYLRVLINPSELAGCRNLSRDFLTRLVELSDKSTRQFTVTPAKKKFIARRDKISINVSTTASRHLYCWIISPDRQAYVLFPWTKQQAAKVWAPGETLQYPQSFKSKVADGSVSLRDVVYPHAAKELFGCFGSAKRLPEALETKWIEMHAFNKGGGGDDREVTAKGVQDTIDAMRRVDGIEEHYSWLEVVDK